MWQTQAVPCSTSWAFKTSNKWAIRRCKTCTLNPTSSSPDTRKSPLDLMRRVWQLWQHDQGCSQYRVCFHTSKKLSTLIFLEETAPLSFLITKMTGWNKVQQQTFWRASTHPQEKYWTPWTFQEIMEATHQGPWLPIWLRSRLWDARERWRSIPHQTCAGDLLLRRGHSPPSISTATDWTRISSA